MIASTTVAEEVLDRRPLRSINDYSNDEDAEAALKDSIHCMNILKYPEPQQPSLVDWKVPGGTLESSTRQAAVARELRRLKSLKSFQILDEDLKAGPSFNSDRRYIVSSGACPNKDIEKEDNTARNGAQGNENTTASTGGSMVAVDPVMSTLNRVVDMATLMFNVSTAVISVTDMERQKVLASKGFDESIQELPRDAAVGACIVSSQQDTLVVPDLTTDTRFQHLEVGSSRFYASVALVTPEGERIGAVCVFDTKPRPEGLDEQQLRLFRNLGEMTMQSLLERRTRLRLTEKLQAATKVVSATVHDLLTPLTAIELAVSLLHEDQDFQNKLSRQQKESVKIASNCVGVLGQMCRRMRDQHSASCKRHLNNSSMTGSIPIAAPSSLLELEQADFGLSADSFRIMYGTGQAAHGPGGSKATNDAATGQLVVGNESTTSVFEANVLAAPHVSVSIQDLVKNIHMAVDAIPKTAPVEIAVDASVPARIVTDDVKVLRCALNLLEHCATISTSGSILLSVQPQYCCCGKAMLRFHCVNRLEESSRDTSCFANVKSIRGCCSTTPRTTTKAASGTSTEQGCCHRHGAFEQQCLRNCSEINLFSVAMLMDALGGDCGLDHPAANGDCNSGGKTEGESFWFRIPLVEPLPSKDDKEQPEVSVASEPDQTGFSTKRGSDDGTKSEQLPGDSTKECGEAPPIPEKKRTALIIEDSIVIRKVIANALSKIGFETETAVNGMEGLHHLQCSTYHVVLCDFLMPVMDGLDCVMQYRDWERINRPGFRQYIIGMSAHASDQDVARGLKVGMDSYKPKPLTYKGLKNIIDACESEQKWSARIDQKTSNTATDRNAPFAPTYSGQQPKMCLIAARDKDSYDLARLTEARGWKSLIVHDGEDALHALKKRNWDAVVLDEKLPLLNGKRTAHEFRLWESNNRVNCQTNVFILASSENCKVPSSVNGVLTKPVDPKAFETMLKNAEEPSLNIIMR